MKVKSTYEPSRLSGWSSSFCFCIAGAKNLGNLLLAILSVGEVVKLQNLSSAKEDKIAG